MNTIFIKTRAIYDCNLFQKRRNMIATSELVLKSRDYDFWTNLAKTNFRSLQSYLVLFEKDCNHIQYDSELSSQSYLVPFMMKIALILGSHHKNYCNHKWSSPIKVDGPIKKRNRKTKLNYPQIRKWTCRKTKSERSFELKLDGFL